MPDFEYVNPQSFGALAEQLTGQAVIGVDTEFMRETTFLPELCLLQIATPERIFCADPIGDAGDERADLDDFWRALAGRGWIVHAGRQDIEVLYLTAGMTPHEIFDTQIAAALLGFAPQLGYAALMAELFGVKIAKLHTRTDWRRRPLPQDALEYAAEDVEYLLPACDALSERLSAVGRLEWARQDAAELLDRNLYAPDPASAIDRLKGARYLRGRPRRIAADLAAWREAQALRLNRPRQWILRDAALLEIAVACPGSERALSSIPALPPRTARRVGRELLELVKGAASRPDGDRDQPAPPGRLDDRGVAALKELQTRVAAVAARLGIVPEVIASRKELSAALSGGRSLRLFRGWRRELIGEDLLRIL
ncbi:MAG TPA: ribonuclease D [Woeseiaceae bacterium]|nr:ribonuclease D [Woeseiaceae bacterium]